MECFIQMREFDTATFQRSTRFNCKSHSFFAGMAAVARSSYRCCRYKDQFWSRLLADYRSSLLDPLPVVGLACRCASSSSKGSRRWYDEHTRDPFVRMRQEMNYRSRSSFKLLEIAQKYKLMQDGDTVVELGAAPGGWTQVLIRQTNAHGRNCRAAGGRRGFVVAADISNMDQLAGARLLTNCDILTVEGHDRIVDALPEDRTSVDGVCSDMAPNLTGDGYTDHVRILKLCRAALYVATQRLPLRVGTGWFLCKIFDGPHLNELTAECQQYFRRVTLWKPSASREASSEQYLLARHRLSAEEEEEKAKASEHNTEQGYDGDNGETDLRS